MSNFQNIDGIYYSHYGQINQSSMRFVERTTLLTFHVFHFERNEDENNIRVNESNPLSKVRIRVDDRSRAKPYRVKWIETRNLRDQETEKGLARRMGSILYHGRESALVERVVRSRFSSMERKACRN